MLKRMLTLWATTFRDLPIARLQGNEVGYGGGGRQFLRWQRILSNNTYTRGAVSEQFFRNSNHSPTAQRAAAVSAHQRFLAKSKVRNSTAA